MNKVEEFEMSGEKWRDDPLENPSTGPVAAVHF